MKLQFKELFSLKVSHGYYDDTCRDFAYVVPDQTAKNLRRGGLVAREKDGELHVFYEGASNTPRVSIAGTTLRIGLLLQNHALLNCTDEAAVVAPKVLHHRNGASPAALDAPEAVPIVGNVFSHSLGKATRPVTVTVKDALGATLATDSITAAADRPAAAFDLTGFEPGQITVTEDYGGSKVTSNYCFDPSLRAAGVSSVVDIAIDGSFYTTPPAFVVAFAARKETLTYHFVVTSYNLADLSVTDAGFAADGRNEVIFVRDDADVPDEIPLPPNTHVTTFKSNVPVPRRAAGRRNIHLNLKNEVLITHLPQPSPERPDARIILHLSK